MSTFTFDGTAAASNEAAQRGKADTLRAAALAMLSIRFIQGFVYWGGGSRRFIYAPGKLDPNAANWMANKFQSAMLGALLGTDLLHHFYLLYRFAPGPYGLRAQMGAKATITLPVTGAVAIIGSVGRPNWSYAP